MSTAAADLDKRDGDIESYLENFCRQAFLCYSNFADLPNHFIGIFRWLKTKNLGNMMMMNNDGNDDDAIMMTMTKVAEMIMMTQVAEGKEPGRLEKRGLGGRGG